MPRKARTSQVENADADVPGSRNAVAFVTYHGPHRRATTATRKLIHQQAMKEIGKTRRKSKDTRIVELDLSLLESSDRPDLPPASWWLGVRWTAADNLNLVASFRVEMNPLEQRLVAVIFQDDGQQRPLRDAWFSVGMTDKAAFMAVLSNSALHVDSIRRGGRTAEESGAAVKYQTEAVGIISQRLKTASPQVDVEEWDATIGAVSGLVCNADIRGIWEDWNTHLRGMQQLIQLRGGIDKLDSNVALRVTVSWVELRGAFMFDVAPIFPLPRQWYRKADEPYLSADAMMSMISLRAAWTTDSVVGHETQWLDIFEEMQTFSHDSFEKSESTTAAVPHFAGEIGAWTNSVIHKLLTFRPALLPLSPQAFTVLEACRLAGLLYMIPVWRFFGVGPVESVTLQTSLHRVLQDDVRNHDDSRTWGQLWKLQLWVLYVGAMESLGGPSESWYLGEIVSISVMKGITSWSEWMTVVESVLWFACVFGDGHWILQEKMDVLFQEQAQRSGVGYPGRAQELSGGD